STQSVRKWQTLSIGAFRPLFNHLILTLAWGLSGSARLSVRVRHSFLMADLVAGVMLLSMQKQDTKKPDL
ncbi:MAG: hypothetical protein ACKOZT_02590, partial [Cyanobium sp.]